MPYVRAFLPAPAASQARSVRDVPRCASTNATPVPPLPPRRPSNPTRRPRRQSARRIPPRVHAQNIHRPAVAGDLTAMQAAVRAAVTDGFTLSAVNYTIIANAHAEHGDPAHAFSVLSLMRSRNVSPTNVTLRVAIKACDVWKAAHPAVDALLTALTWAAQDTSDGPDERTWNLALRALARKSATPQMLTVLRWMRTGVTNCLPGVQQDDRENIPRPSACSYNTCLHALGRKGDFAEAIRLFAEILVRQHEGNDLHVDVVTYNSLLEMAVNSNRFAFPDGFGKTPEAVGANECDPSHFVHAITNSMLRHDVQTNITTETLILRLLTRKHSTPPDSGYIRSRMLQVLESADQNKYDIDKKYFDALIIAFGQAIDIDGVASAFEGMISQGIRLDFLTVRALLQAAYHCADVQLAIRIIDACFDNDLQCDDRMYTTAIATCAKAKPPDPETAEFLLSQALARGTTWTSAMVNAAISSYEGNVSKAVDLWKKLRNCSDASSATVLEECCVYEALMRVCGRGSRPDFALRIFYAAKRASHVSPNTPESRAIFNSFMRGVRESNAEAGLNRNPLKRQYLRHLRTECGGLVDMNVPFERIRIKF